MINSYSAVGNHPFSTILQDFANFYNLRMYDQSTSLTRPIVLFLASKKKKKTTPIHRVSIKILVLFYFLSFNQFLAMRKWKTDHSSLFNFDVHLRWSLDIAQRPWVRLCKQKPFALLLPAYILDHPRIFAVQTHKSNLHSKSIIFRHYFHIQIKFMSYSYLKFFRS